jgi:beta-mannanase
MEVYVDVYPWQKQAPNLYAKAFNHFAETIKKEAPAVKMVWAPAGYPGTEEYWPGTKWVDMVSVTLKGRSEMLTNNYPEEKSLQQLIFRKLHRTRFFDKPVLLIGSEKLLANDFKQQDFDAAAKYIDDNKAIEYKDAGAADGTTVVLRKDGEMIIGAFDPTNRLLDSMALSAEHIFVNISDLKKGEFKNRFDNTTKRNLNVIVTMEPWKDGQLEKDPELVANILKGSYDKLFEQLYSVIGNTDKTIYLRWLHEMEIPITRYPWQSQDPVMYIKAYRYFVDFIRSKKPQHIYFVWGPAGDRGSMEFWPGSDVVDYTSIAIYGLPDKNITDHNQQESFNNIFKRKFRRIWFAHKPLLITEFGVKGPASYKKEWLAAAAATINANKEIVGVSYFNDVDNPKAWGDIEAPDWSVSPEVYKNFVKQIDTSSK